MNESYGFEIDVPVRNEWSNVTLLVTSVQNCFHAMFGDIADSHNVAMVTGELLENAIKYGDWSSAANEHRLRLRVAGSPERASITVENPATADSYADLRNTLDWIEKFPSPDEAYRARLLALAQTTDPDVSKLGLVRIANEGRCRISASYQDGAVRISAEIKRVARG
jgi:hypothetical protein